jgi:hypothetical protein
MKPLDAAILRTILYADVFDFPLTAAEVHFFLIHDRPVSALEMRHALETSPALAAALHRDGDYVMLASRPALSASRRAREQASQRLWPLAESWGRWLARLPYVRLVAVTGALAVRNAAAADDDLDFFLLTTPGRVWLARAFAVALARLARLRGVTLCPNYIAATTALAQNHCDLFIAHEIAQMIPLYGPDLYQTLRDANPWTAAHLPNAHAPFYTPSAVPQSRPWGALKRLAEAGLNNRLGDALENWERQRKLARFGGQMQQPHSAALLDATQVKGHFNDYGYQVLCAYRERLRACGLDDDLPLRATGD